MPKKVKKRDKNGKKGGGRQIKPADTSCAGACQYAIKEEVVDRKKVSEKDVFAKGKAKPKTKKEVLKKV
tara:strand:- start:1706 stop:1912 length:207 start_codon:yes stop_codon:yes gene_type:complete